MPPRRRANVFTSQVPHRLKVILRSASSCAESRIDGNTALTPRILHLCTWSALLVFVWTHIHSSRRLSYSFTAGLVRPYRRGSSSRWLSAGEISLLHSIPSPEGCEITLHHCGELLPRTIQGTGWQFRLGACFGDSDRVCGDSGSDIRHRELSRQHEFSPNKPPTAGVHRRMSISETLRGIVCDFPRTPCTATTKTS